MKLDEPPSCSPCSTDIVLIGRNSRGQWVAKEQKGLYGGLFINRSQAIKYARFENGDHRERIIELSQPIELDMTASVLFSPSMAYARKRGARSKAEMVPES